MAEEFKDDAPEHPALKGFNSTWEKVKHVVKKTAIIALKGAVIGGLMLAAGSLVVGGPAALVEAVPLLGTHIISPALKFIGASASDWVLGGLTTGAIMGGIAGAAIGLANGVSGADDAVEDMEQTRITKFNKSRQLAAQQEMMAMNMQRMQASTMQMGAGMQPSYNPNMPSLGQNMGPGAGRN